MHKKRKLIYICVVDSKVTYNLKKLDMPKKDISYYSNVIWDLEESEEMHLILAQSKIDKKTADALEVKVGDKVRYIASP